MCGIAGIVKIDGRIGPEDVVAVQRMTDAQVHRGPDDSGLYHDQCAVLGTRRLCIIDLSEAGRQPMSNEDGTVWVTYNGEVYNFPGLRQELSGKGHIFRSRTDTEVLVHGYEEWGIEKLLSRLRGMYAFGIWDTKTQRLFLARDRLGKKPLYYSWDGKQLCFASEIKALLASGMIERRLSPAGTVAYLTFGSVPAPLTMIEGVEVLPPASYLALQDTGVRVKSYWHLAFSGDSRLTEEEAVERLRALLREAVRVRLVADVPVGAFLSGGIDSSAIVALMRETTGGTIRTFSMVFREKEFSEGSFARSVARKFETEHTEHEVTATEVLAELPRIIRAMDQPTIDGVNTYFVSKATRKSGTIVALSGIGGDELFGGYPSFRLVPRLFQVSRIAQAVPGCRWAFQKALDFFPPNGKVAKLKALFSHPASLEMAYLAVRGLFLDRELSALVQPDVLEQACRQFTPVSYLKDVMDDHLHLGLANVASLLELRTYMHNQLLRDTDVMSMAHSLEVRTPFLDHPLVEFLATVPARHKFSPRPKRLLLEALNGKLPSEATDRPKGTFTFPFERWLNGEWTGAIEESLQLQNDAGLNQGEIQALRQRFLSGKAHWSRLWAVMVLQLWTDAITREPIVRV